MGRSLSAAASPERYKRLQGLRNLGNLKLIGLRRLVAAFNVTEQIGITPRRSVNRRLPWMFDFAYEDHDDSSQALKWRRRS